jgi:Tfp pilus assembly protein PilP
MKPAIAITTTTLVCILAAGLVSAQSPTIIQNTRDTMNGVSASGTAASNVALGVQAAPTNSPTRISATPVNSPAAARSPHGSKPGGQKHGPRPMALRSAPAVVVVSTAVTKSDDDKNKRSASAASAGTGENPEPEQPTTPDTKFAANGRRDPFISPVVSHAGGSGCSSGKKCLEIGAINLRGVVHAENGFIAVVSNGLNKAYFLRENDPVFNGYVVKITGDSIVFQETLQDRLGKTFTREVVKKITTPAV